MNRRRFIAGATAVLVAGVGTTVVAAGPGAGSGGANETGSGTDQADTASLETATVRRGDLSTEREFTATVSYGDRWAVTTAASGTITESRAAGAVVEPGQWLVRVDDRPVTLARGTMPMYRELHKVDTRLRDQNGDRLKRLTGADVTQLQRFLIEAGFDADGDLEPDGEFGPATEEAVEDWQASAGLAATGRVDNSQLVFEPDAVRIAVESRIGDGFTSVEVTGAEAKILVDTSTRDRSALPVGAQVEVEVEVDVPVEGEASTVAGTVADQEQVTAQDGSTLWRTTITADRQPPAQVGTAKVTVTQLLAEDVLIVPVTALLALSEGGFGVELVTGDAAASGTSTGTALVPVDVGQVLDGMAEISGDIDEGDTVVVPT